MICGGDEKLTGEEIIDKAVDSQRQSRREQEQQKVIVPWKEYRSCNAILRQYILTIL